MSTPGPTAALVAALLLLGACTGSAAAPDSDTARDAGVVDPMATAIPAPVPPPPPTPGAAGAVNASPTPTPTPGPGTTPPPAATAEAASPFEAPSAEPSAPEVLGTFDVALAPEVSGIVASQRDPDLLWLLDDGPGTTSVVAVRRSGELVTRVEMLGVQGRDTEGLAAGPCGAADPTPCLYVGDIGDNTASRDRILVHRFPEPTADAASTTVTTASYTHPGGPVDAEALLVGDDGLPVILTKEPDFARIMVATAFADGPLVEVGTLSIPPPLQPALTLFTGLTVTGADVSADQQRVLLRTYDHVVELRADQPGSGLGTLARWTATQLPVATEGQGEAVAYLDSDGSYVTASEDSGVLSVVWRG